MSTYLLYGVLALLAYIFLKISERVKRFSYFKARGISQLNSNVLFGIVNHVGNKSPGENDRTFYEEFKKMGVKHGGVYVGSTRSWVVVDPELIKNILIKDFTYFTARFPQYPGLFFNNIFYMDGAEWKDMRRKLTPTFTTGKMKMMFNIIAAKTSGLVNLVDEMCALKKPTEIKALLARFTTDVIGSCGFGIECNSVEDVNSEFFRQGQAIFTSIASASSMRLLYKILVLLGLRSGAPNFKPVEDFFREVVRNTLKYREDNKVIRKDFLHLMIQLKNKGVVTELINDTEDVYEKTVNTEVMSLEDIAGQCLLFFIAGFETSSTTMSYALLELSQNQDVQKKLREEVREVLKRHNGNLTYDAVQEMTYCDLVIQETLRKYPTVSTLARICTKSYTIPGTNSVIEKGTPVSISAFGIQNDPEYWTEPEKFDPERFSTENKRKIKDFTYFPFGEGPRMCLGMRFGMMQSKAGVAALINKFNFTLNKKTPYPPQYDKHNFLLAVEGGIWLNAVKVN